MKPSEIREKTQDELEGLESELRRQLWKARFDNHTNQLMTRLPFASSAATSRE